MLRWSRKVPGWFRAVLLALVLFISVCTLRAQTSCDSVGAVIDRAQPKGVTPEEILKKVAAWETEFKQARERYTYTLDVTVQTLTEKNIVDGEFRKVADIGFDEHGKRIEKISFAPASTLTRVVVTPEDLENLSNHFAFPLTSYDLPQYDVRYAGGQHLDELDTYVFDVVPRRLENGKRFRGQIWVDAGDFQIVKTCGKDVYVKSRNIEQKKTLVLVTYREEIDGQYWFPTYSRADEILHFATEDVHVREIVKYTKYRRIATKTGANGDAAAGSPSKKRN